VSLSLVGFMVKIMREVPKIIQKHRDQFADLSELLDEAKGYEELKFVKLLTETVAIQQRCERRAYIAKLCEAELARRLGDKKDGEALKKSVV